MALHQLAQFAIESLLAGSAIVAAFTLARSWKEALPQIARLRAELSAGVTCQQLCSTIRTVDVCPASGLAVAVVKSQRPAFRAPMWGELRAAA